jgi:hypothetical protein
LVFTGPAPMKGGRSRQIIKQGAEDSPSTGPGLATEQAVENFFSIVCSLLRTWLHET